MNDYGFDYLNYINNIPNNMNYSKMNTNYNLENETNMHYMNFNKNNYNMMNNTISDVNIGWMRGNLFPNLYEQYKNYKPIGPNPKTERETLLFQIMQYKFALIDLNLYLDTNPNDMEAISLYNKYLEIEKEMCKKYESMYGVLTLDSKYLDKNGWAWKNNPWPWEVM